MSGLVNGLPETRTVAVRFGGSRMHLFNCGDCLKRLIEIDYVLTLSEMLGDKLAPCTTGKKALFVVHDTGDGFIYSRTERRGQKWFARHWGEQLDGGRECVTMREANDYLAQSFCELFPEHRCTGRCRIDPLRCEV